MLCLCFLNMKIKADITIWYCSRCEEIVFLNALTLREHEIKSTQLRCLTSRRCCGEATVCGNSPFSFLTVSGSWYWSSFLFEYWLLVLNFSVLGTLQISVERFFQYLKYGFDYTLKITQHGCQLSVSANMVMPCWI